MYWLLKAEPEDYSIEDFEKDSKTVWTGIRNYAARNNLSTMRLGDLCLFYRSVVNPSVMGIVKVVKEFFPDPTTEEKAWVSVELEWVETFPNPVSLKVIKQMTEFEKMILLKISRLSVQPVTQEEFLKICEMGRKEG